MPLEKAQETIVTPKIEKNRHGVGRLLVVIVLLVVMLGLFYYLGRNLTSPLSWLRKLRTGGVFQIKAPSPTPTPRKIPHGSKGFTVSQADKTIPQLSKGTIDPYDPAKGGTQTVTITAKHSQPIKKVSAILKTDNTVSIPYDFKLISGTDMDGVWKGSWVVDDKYLYTYGLTLEAESASGSARVDITLR